MQRRLALKQTYLGLNFRSVGNVTNDSQGNDGNTGSEDKPGGLIRMETHCVLTRFVEIQKAVVELDTKSLGQHYREFLQFVRNWSFGIINLRIVVGAPEVAVVHMTEQIKRVREQLFSGFPSRR